MTINDDLQQLEILDWWELHRWSAAQACAEECARLKAHVRKEVEALSVSEIIASSSEERAQIEAYLAHEIDRIAAELTKNLVADLPALVETTQASPTIADYNGLSYWDWTKALIGGGAPAALALTGARVAPGFLAAFGLAAIAAPAAIALAVGGIVWSAYSTTDGKRTAYLDALSDGIDRVLLKDPAESVLARHHEVLGRIFKIKMGDAS